MPAQAVTQGGSPTGEIPLPLARSPKSAAPSALSASRSRARFLERQERARPIFASAAHFLVGCDANIAAAYERDWPVAPERKPANDHSRRRRHEFDEILAMLNK